MGKFKKLVLFEKAGYIDPMVKNSPDELFVYLTSAKDEYDLLRANGFKTDDPTKFVTVSLGQLFVRLARLAHEPQYPWMTILPKEDSLTVLKMAQERSESEDLRVTPTLSFYSRLALKLSERETPVDADPVSEFYEDFVKRCKMADVFSILSLVRSSLTNIDDHIDSLFRRLCVVIESEAIGDLMGTEFGNSALRVLVDGAESLEHHKDGTAATLSADDWKKKVALTVDAEGNRKTTLEGTPKTPGRPKSILESSESHPRPKYVTPQRSSPRLRHSPLQHSFASPVSSTESFSRRVFFAYLRLVLNSRDELALARCIDTPSRGLDHNAFTDLRHEAESKGMPMFQTASSFVVRIKLGGNGYQAGVDCPLNLHVKGLSELVDLIEKCQNVIEEGDKEPEKSLIRVVNLLKNSICKSRDNRLRITSVEKAAKKIREMILVKHGHFKLHKSILNVSLPSSGDETKKKLGVCGSKTKELLKFIMDEEAGASLFDKTMTAGGILDDAYSSTATPVRFPSLWSQFQSPKVEQSPTLQRPRELSSQSHQSPVLRERNPLNRKFESARSWAMTDSPPCAPLADDENDPAATAQGPTLMMSRTKFEEAEVREATKSASADTQTTSRAKRPRDDDDDFENKNSILVPDDDKAKPVPRAPKLAKKDKPKARRKIIPLVEGQRKLSAFFK